jgi:hypothetical protein
MSTTTTNLGLLKPELSDPADITKMNDNWDIIDEALVNCGIPIIEATSSDGITYTATLEGLTVKTGTKITIVPNMNTSKYTFELVLKLNGTSYSIMRRTSGMSDSMGFDTVVNFFANHPYTLTYYGSNFVLEGYDYANASELNGTVAIRNGGTGATTVAEARTNLGAAPEYTYGTTDLTAGITALETGKLHFVYE